MSEHHPAMHAFEKLGRRQDDVTEGYRADRLECAEPNSVEPSARCPTADALGSTLSELEAGLVDPEQLPGDVARLYRAYRAELERLELVDWDIVRRRAVADREPALRERQACLASGT